LWQYSFQMLDIDDILGSTVRLLSCARDSLCDSYIAQSVRTFRVRDVAKQTR